MNRLLSRPIVLLVVFCVVLWGMFSWRSEWPSLCLFVASAVVVLAAKVNRTNIGGALAALCGAILGVLATLLYHPPMDLGFEGGLLVLAAIVGGLSGSIAWRLLLQLRNLPRTPTPHRMGGADQ